MADSKIVNLLLLFAAIGVYSYFGIKGIGWGLPGKERCDLVLPQDLRIAGFYDLMVQKRQDIYNLTGQSSLGRLAGEKDQNLTPIMKSLGVNADSGLKFNGETGILADFVRPYLLRSNHPDEQMTLALFAAMNPRKLDFNPRLFQYGGAYIYPLGAWLGGLHVFKIIKLTGSLAYYFENPNEMAKIFVASRAFSLLFGIASLVMLYFIALRHFGARVAVIASLLYSLMPAMVFQVHVMKPYPESMFFSLAALLFSLKILDDPTKQTNYAMAGVFSGLALGSMPFYGIVITTPMAAFVLAKERRLKSVLLFCAALGVVFLMINPYWLLDNQRLLVELKWFSGGKTTFVPSISAFFVTRQLSSGSSALFIVLSACGAIASYRLYGRKGILLVISALVPVLVAAALFKYPDASLHTARLVLPWMAMLCILSAGSIDFLLSSKKLVLLVAGYLLVCATGFELFARSYICAENFRLDSSVYSTRLLAGRWINENITPGSDIGVFGLPGPYNVPPIDFRRYKISVVFNADVPESAGYFVCNVNAACEPEKKGYVLEKAFMPFETFAGIKYNMGLTSLNTGFRVYKKQKGETP